MIHKLSLTNFRNFKKENFEFNSGVNVINAPNASGITLHHISVIYLLYW